MANVTINGDLCKGCGLCADACPKKILALDAGKINGKGFHPAAVSFQERCTGCAFCAVMCPDNCITVEK